MMTDYNESFDQKIRKVLLDAEEKVPSRVWGDVSRRLPGRFISDWRRIGLVAAVAAVCCVIVLVGTVDRHDIGEPQDITGQVTILPAAEERPVIYAESVKPTKTSNVSGYVAELEKDSVEVAERALDEVPSSETMLEESENMIVSNLDNQKETRTDVWPDPFSEDDESELSSERKTCFDFKGAFSTNRSNIQFETKGIQSSPAYITGGIEDISESSYGLPFTVGIGVRWYLGKRFSIGTGVDYSLLTRKFTGNYYPKDGSSIIMLNADIQHSLSYIGIPVNAFFDIIQHSLVGLYAFGGAEVERSISNSYRISDGSTTQYYNEAVAGCQYSAQLGLGVEFRINDFMGIYIDPCLKFYFVNDQPTSMRTQQPLMFSGAIGLRFELPKK